jgi:hypothetical protein
MKVDWIAILCATGASWAFGAAWYGALARPWMAAARLPAPAAEGAGRERPPVAALVVSLVAQFVMALILAGVLAHTAKKGVTVASGMTVGAICWLGFVITSLAANNVYLKARLTLTLIDGGHWLGVLLIQGAALGALL